MTQSDHRRAATGRTPPRRIRAILRREGYDAREAAKEAARISHARTV